MNDLIYGHSFDFIYFELLTKLKRSPCSINKEDKKLYELINASFFLMNPQNCFAVCRDMSFDYLQGELQFYLSGSPFLKDIVKYASFWNGVSDDGRSVNSNYGKLLLHDRNLHNYTQFEYAKSALIKNRESKKAVMSIYNKEHAYKTNDNPCTMYLQFLIRDDKLNLFVKMRSSDVWFGLPYDVPFFIFIQYKMLMEYNLTQTNKVQLGAYSHQAGSLHLYERNLEQVKEILKAKGKNLLNNQSDLFRKYLLNFLVQG